jgi:hypothetical protein
MGPIPNSYGYFYILVVADYVSKWVEAIACKSNDHKVVLQFLKDNVCARFGTPHAIISDGGKHFCNRFFEQLMKKYGITHKIATPYHTQTSGQVELSNKEMKRILEKMVNPTRKDWFLQLNYTVGIPDIIQDSYWHVSLPACIWKGLPSSHRIGASSLLGHQATEF